MRIRVTKRNGSLVPVDQLGQDFFEELSYGKEYRVSIKENREHALHKKFFAILGQIVEMSDLYTGKSKSLAVEELLEKIKFKTGHYTIFLEKNGLNFIKTKSISFKNMDNLEFEAFYQTATSIIVRESDQLGIDINTIDF